MKMRHIDICPFGAGRFQALTRISLPRKNSSAAGPLVRLLDTKRPRFWGIILYGDDQQRNEPNDTVAAKG
jgi:hypothetical protein